MSYRHPTAAIRWPALALALVAAFLVGLVALILSDAAPGIDRDAGLAVGLWTVSIVSLIRFAALGRGDWFHPFPKLIAISFFFLGLAVLAVTLLSSIGA